ncbi:leucyl/phenylalanyl-tRNA--protein transferase [Desulfogranum mediterraneum]|uniref:leucyl/phenylalanyl-tRNA--protein transferase n=1 Tax=Desulfogranum mediterraneum TaxID=160661 RepID=UPI00040AAA92|nr:leucyl/phenylalanyl-tRNA--protein transferase [Desulfogranum mediterraneum]
MPVFRLTQELIFPPPQLAEPEGLLAVGGDLSPERLLSAYRSGIFPWYSQGEPLLWWSPAPRLVLFPEEFHLPRRLARTIRQGRFRLTADTAFSAVIAACARTIRRDEPGTWITPEMQQAYIRLHELGHAHSIECWQGGKLAGGLYGVALDGVFFGESMFTRVRDASKVALAQLVHHAPGLGLAVIDCQMTTRHLLGFGAREVEREVFLSLLAQHIRSIPALQAVEAVQVVQAVQAQKKWRLYLGKEGTHNTDASQEGMITTRPLASGEGGDG